MILNIKDIIDVMNKNSNVFYDIYSYLNDDELKAIKQQKFNPLSIENYYLSFNNDLVQALRSTKLKTTDPFINYLLLKGKKPKTIDLNKILNLINNNVMIDESIIDNCLPDLIHSIHVTSHHFFEKYHDNIVRVLIKKNRFLSFSFLEDDHFFKRLIEKNQLIDLLPLFNQIPSNPEKYIHIKNALYTDQKYLSHFKAFIRLIRQKDIPAFLSSKNIDSQNLIEMIIENNLCASKKARSLLSDDFQQRALNIINSANLLKMKEKDVKQLFINEFIDNTPIQDIRLE